MEALKPIPLHHDLDNRTLIIYREISNPFNLMNKLRSEQESLKDQLYDATKKINSLKEDLDDQKTLNIVPL